MALFQQTCFLLLVSVFFCHQQIVQGLSQDLHSSYKGQNVLSRRAAIFTAAQAVVGGSLVVNPPPAFAVPDCFQDCMNNCKKIAPKDPDYCTMNCKGYCEQDDRTDGLSGSVSAASGEVGILGGTFGAGTVTKGEDRPPSVSLPGLDFGSDKGKKLIGY